MICRLANALSDYGMGVQMFSLDDPDAKSFYPLGKSVTWLRLGRETGLGGKVRRVLRMCEAMRENRSCALIGFVMAGDKTVYAAAKLAGVKLIAAERNAPDMYKLRYGLFTRWLSFSLLRLTDAIVVQFPNYIQGYPKALHARAVSIGNPVEPAAMRAKPNTPDNQGRFSLLAVGRLDGVQKRMDVLVKAFAMVAGKHPHWDLRIIGDGPQKDDILNHLRLNGLERRCVIEDAHLNIFEAYANAHLFVMPSLWEGFPNALAEAMAHGLPAVGFADAPGVRHLIRDCGGWLASGVDDPVALARVLDIAMSDGGERERRSQLAEDGMRAYAPDTQLGHWCDLIERICVR